jgi:Subtilase family
MDQFPHLKIVQKLEGKARFTPGGKPSIITQEKLNDRQRHSGTLSQKTQTIKSDWSNDFLNRTRLELAPIDEDIIPVFIQINPELLNNIEFNLQAFGIEILSEEDDGYIIGASLDNLQSLEDKINGFITKEYGTGKIAEFWDIFEGNREAWRPKHILSENLLKNWDKIQDEKLYSLEVSVAFDKPLGKKPDITKQGGVKRLANYRQKQEERDDKLMERENHFGNFIKHYGTIESSLINFDDSFGCEVKITGKGLKDLVVNYQFVFEVSEIEEVSNFIYTNLGSDNFELSILPPDDNSPEVGIIDSGIMENHKYIVSAIKNQNSKSYVKGSDSVADLVHGGGHGTQVGGAVLYPQGVSLLDLPYKLPFFLRNLRVLNEDNILDNKYPAELMKKIVEENEECKIFNLSITSRTASKLKHMSTWAAMIDTLIHEKNILFLISAGNLTKNYIQDCIKRENGYPFYQLEPFCRIANPAQSSFALTVGSISSTNYEDEYWKSIEKEQNVSAFSRVGLGIWGQIKPDVVEYGGGLLISKNNDFSIKANTEAAPELISSTLYGGSAYGRSNVGSSYATPKVTHIVAQLKKLYPNDNVNLLRALVVQGARLPHEHFNNPSKQSIQFLGYGIPSLERVTKNSKQRITLYNTGEIRAEEGHIFSLLIPQEFRNPADEYDILIEITLAYTAKIRRTRQKTKSYLSTWLDWTTSKIGETYKDFKDFALSEIETVKTNYDTNSRSELVNFNWTIKNRADHGNIQDINRNNSTIQKDWTIIKSYSLPEEICFAVRAHKGWDKDKSAVPYALTVSIEALNADLPIYEKIKIENEIEIEIEI